MSSLTMVTRILPPRVSCQTALYVCLLAGTAWVAGCSPQPAPLPKLTMADVGDDELREVLDATLDYTFQKRQLSLEQHAAWQILHGALAFGRDFHVQRGGDSVSAVQHLLDGGSMRGWEIQIVPYPDGSRGLRALLAPGSNAGQGHHDQWLAVLSQCNLPADQPLLFNGGQYSISHIVRQIQADVHRNEDREFSWTLIGLTQYLPTDAQWKAADGTPWSVARLVELEVQQGLAEGACGGSHRLIGVTMALDRHRRSGGAVDGPWKDAQQLIEQSVVRARELQNPDGSFSTNYFSGPGRSPDNRQNLGTSGHVLEFLALTLSDEELKEAWVQRSVLYCCDLLKKTEGIPLECGALYHAAHALVLYRQRVFGPRIYGKTSENPATSVDPAPNPPASADALPVRAVAEPDSQ